MKSRKRKYIYTKDEVNNHLNFLFKVNDQNIDDLRCLLEKHPNLDFTEVKQKWWLFIDFYLNLQKLMIEKSIPMFKLILVFKNGTYLV